MGVGPGKRAGNRDRWLLLAGLLVVLLGAALGYWARARGPHGPGLPTLVEEAPQLKTGEIRQEDGGPSLHGFKGDLELGGTPGHDGKVNPFVLGDIITLDVAARRIEAFRWTCEGQLLDRMGEEWSREAAREFAFKKSGTYRFKVEGRGADGSIRVLEKALKVYAAKIEYVDSDANPVDLQDRYLVGETFNLAVHMVEPLTEVEYQYRYLVNEKVVPHPPDRREWSPNAWLNYSFEQPGEYRFKVQVRRSSVTQVEDEVVLAKPIRVGMAVVDTFIVDPPAAVVGSKVMLIAVTWTQGQSSTTCRFGVLDLRSPDEEYDWLLGADGKDWGTDTRVWVPKRPGNYQIRVEVSDGEGTPPDDFRTELVTVSEGKEDF